MVVVVGSYLEIYFVGISLLFWGICLKSGGGMHWMEVDCDIC